ncbi:MAG: tRNA-dihydrouridine synthase family protein [Bacteroidales bacterium]|nr:tRNA-dihydrouridine synthase family protein [Bacteroidales bacterium]
MIILAPMQGLTELLFRKAYHKVFPQAIDLAVSPFLSLTHGNLNHAIDKVSDVWPEANIDSIPVIPQILGKETDEFVALANRLYDLGYEEVNWNIGCPMRRVAGKHRGSGILPYPDEVREVLDGVVPRLKGRLSVKMRLGYLRSDEIYPLVPILNSHPLASVTIHPRIGKQVYTGVPDIEAFADVLTLIEHPVIYNGDICTAERYHYLRQRFPQVEDFMIGRGILYDPLLPLRIKGLPLHEELAKTFLRTLVDAILDSPITEAAKIRKIKEYWCLQYKSLHLTEQQRIPLLHCSDLPSVLHTLDELLSQ